MGFWDVFAPLYDLVGKMNREAYDGMLNFISETVPDGSNILECAAGTGSISIACAPGSGRILCTDMSAKMLKVAERKAERSGISNIEFRECDIYKIDEPDDSWDVVIAAQVIHLLDDPGKAVSELRRVATDMVIIPVGLLNELSRGGRMKFRLFRLLGFRPKERFDEEGYKRFLTDLGLETAEITVFRGQIPLAVAVYRQPQ